MQEIIGSFLISNWGFGLTVTLLAIVSLLLTAFLLAMSAGFPDNPCTGWFRWAVVPALVMLTWVWLIYHLVHAPRLEALRHQALFFLGLAALSYYFFLSNGLRTNNPLKMITELRARRRKKRGG